MFSFIPNYINNTDSNNTSEPEPEVLLFDIDTTFKLPIQYLDKDNLFSLSDTISYDLELKIPSNYESTQTMYDYLFNPTHTFAKNMIPLWQQHITNDILYLNDTKHILTNIQDYQQQINQYKYEFNCDTVKNIWKSIKMDEYFLEKYNFIEWEMLKHLNDSPTFLQALSVAHVLSPIVSFALPILFLIFPFILLKIQGVPITIDVYVKTLQNVAKNHFIGKAISSFQSLSWDKVVYVLFMFGMYVFQIYQNVILCKRFYSNIININKDLLDLRDYIDYTIFSMESFSTISNNCKTYKDFNRVNDENISVLYDMKQELSDIYIFEKNLKKFNTTGYMLQCYYKLYSNPVYENSIRYSVGFHGYIDNLLGIHKNIQSKIISYATFDDKQTCSFKKQYYPGLTNENPVKNDCNFEKNMIISAPNKGGKTTILKSTALNIIFSQQVGCGFYTSATLTPFTHIHSYLNIPDTSGRDSLFQAESRRCKDIIDTINQFSDSKFRHFCLFDELYSGTNPAEASKAGYAFLEYLQQHPNVKFILTTHYLTICKKFKQSNIIQNYKMVVNVNPDGSFDYTYKIKKGISKMKGGVRVLKDLNYPDHIIKTIENID
jgi:hypothetical protein